MKFITKTIAAVALLFANDAMAFSVFFPHIAKKNVQLKKIASEQIGKLLNIRLDVAGQKKGSPHMAINGFVIKLAPDAASKNHPRMPGADFPQMSSGTKGVKVLQEGSFIDMSGTQHARVENGCWEMVWRDLATCSGSLICGFDVPENVRRNGALLPKGKVFLSFSLWTREGLTMWQEKKGQVVKKARELLAEKNAAMKEIGQTKSFIQKALHYRRAAIATEKFYLTGARSYDMVPSDNEVIALGNGLLMGAKGIIWSKVNLTRGKKVTHGEAYVSVPSESLRP